MWYSISSLSFSFKGQLVREPGGQNWTIRERQIDFAFNVLLRFYISWIRMFALFGFTDVLDHNYLLVNHLLLIFKNNVYNSRVNNTFSFQNLKCVISQIKCIEEAISENDLSKKRKILNKWKLIDYLF